MKRKTFILVTAMVVLVLAAPAWSSPVTVDFTMLPSSPGNQGLSLNLDGLTISAKTGMGNVNLFPNPWTGGYNANGVYQPGLAGVAGNVYWGDLGALGTTTTTNPPYPGRNYIGLGALTPTGNQINPNTSNDPITLREALVFTFDQAQAVTRNVNYGQVSYTTNLTFSLLGLNYLTSGNSGFPADSARVFLQLTDGSIAVNDMNAGAIANLGINPNFNGFINWILTNSTHAQTVGISAIAVEEVYGAFTGTNGVRQFGVASITYEAPAAVPEPATMLLLGLGLLGVAGARRKFKK